MSDAAVGANWTRSLRQLLDGLVDVEVPDCEIDFVTLDSRQVKQGALFLATSGIKRHGLEFLDQVWAGGACAVAYEPDANLALPELPADRICVPVPDLSAHAGTIAARFFDQPSKAMPVCGVTGTNGKTTTAHLIATALRFVGRRCGQMGTLGFGLHEPLTSSALTTPDAVALQQRLAWIREQRATHMVMEVSSHALDQERVAAVAFDCAVFTNLSRDHLDYHPDVEHYAHTKKRLFTDFPLAHAVINIDDPVGLELAGQLKNKMLVTTVSTRTEQLDNVDCHLFAHSIETHPQGLRLHINGTAGTAVIESRLLGRFNAHNLLCALGVMLHWQVPLDQAATSLSCVGSPPGRMEIFGRNNDARIVVDYAHTPDALNNAVAALKEHCTGDLWCVFGCGGDRDKGKRPRMAHAAAAADHIIITNDNPRHEDPQAIIDDILAGFTDRRRVQVESDRKVAIGIAVDAAGVGDIVLIAGKGHEDYQIVGAQKLPMSDRDIVTQHLREHQHV
ncbi:MAG: UDP-N-acetylmuramoyl-L-alanyl-D-glutamate--2,6-diaminopimelate ligase [Gammaproteobacteria bacterium]|nr:UDP-N-acetylmuramoyl-L-alanyl-D-glutamate--2,6-diaminopimelate ligase [Gammaproteobacteria bacterium]